MLTKYHSCLLSLSTFQIIKQNSSYMKPYRKLSLPSISRVQWDLLSICCYFSGSRSHVELPFYSKYLLIAAYLSSYNPARTDRRFFSKQGQRKMSKKAKLAAKADKSNTQLTGDLRFSRKNNTHCLFCDFVQWQGSSQKNEVGDTIELCHTWVKLSHFCLCT